MIRSREALLSVCEQGVAEALRVGAHQAEVFVEHNQKTIASVQNDDLSEVGTGQETRFGVRVCTERGQMGFTTTNLLDTLAETAQEALAMARAARPDPLGQLPAPRPIPDQPDGLDAGLSEMPPSTLTRTLMDHIDRLRGIDPRLRVEAAMAEIEVFGIAIASSRGVRAAWRGNSFLTRLNGMAIDGDDMSGLAADIGAVWRVDQIASLLEGLRRRFSKICLGSLGARPGESFRGAMILSPRAARNLLLRPLFSALNATNIRQGRSPMAERLGEAIAISGLDLVEIGNQGVDVQLAPFDREGMPRQTRPLIEAGVLNGYLWSDYESRAAGTAEVGNTQGDASTSPYISPTGVILKGPVIDVERDGPAIQVTRFSGSADPVSGDFSGVVKNGALLRDGVRIPIKETTIAGNVYTCLQNISGVSSQRQVLVGLSELPSVRIEDISITAG